MTVSPGPAGHGSTFPDADYVWQGYLSFWDRALLGQIPYVQVQRYAREWGLPLDFRPIRGGDVFSDIANIARDIGQIVSSIVWNIGNAIWNLVWVPPQFLGDIWNRLSWLGDFVGDRLRWLVNTIWDGVSWTANTLQNRLSYIGDVLGNSLWSIVTSLGDGIAWVGNSLWSVGNRLADNVWNIITWAGNLIWSGISWAGNTLYDGVTWAAGRVWDGLSWVATNIYSAVAAAAARVWDGLVWAGQKVWDGLTWVGGQVWEGATWAATHIWDGLQPAARWLWDTFIDDPFFLPERPLQSVSSLLRPFRTIGDYFERAGALVPVGPGFARIVMGMFTAMALFLVIPQTLATVYAMPLHQLAAEETGAALMSQAQIRDAHLRGIGTGMPAAMQLRRYGFDANKVQAIMQLWDALPTPTDLVRMGVREVFDPAKRAALNLDAEFPADFAFWMRKLGFQPEWSLNYWASHWDLPSATQGFEMFHRNVITQTELFGLLSALDYAPVWRPRLQAIAFNPITRIDLRRMFRAGSLTEAEVRRGYLDLGYSPENAEKIVSWVKTEAAGVSKDLPSGAILRAYRKRLIGAGEASAALEDLGFEGASIELLLSLEDLALEEERADLVEDIVRKDYKAGTIDEGAAASQLAAVGVPPDRVALLLDLWTVERAPRVVTLSAAQVGRLLHERKIAIAEARARWDAMGYNGADIERLIDLSEPEEAALEPRELTVAQLQAAARRGLLSSFLQVRGFLDLLVEEDAATDTELETLHSRLVARGYGTEDAWRLVALGFPEPEEPPEPRERTLSAAQVLRAFKDGILTLDETEARLRELGYSAEDAAILILESLPPQE